MLLSWATTMYITAFAFFTDLKETIVSILYSDGFTFKRTTDPCVLLPFDSLNQLKLIGSLS